MIAGRYTLLDQRAVDELLPQCAERGIAVIAAAPFNSGLLATEAPATGSRFDYTAPPDEVIARATAIAAICRRHGITLPEAALRFPLQHPAVCTVLASARTPAEVSQNATRVAAADCRGSVAWNDLWAELRSGGLIAGEVR
jgi:D-threo-aldose 1-dehydrogenase